MFEKQIIETIELKDLLRRTKEMFDSGFRLIQMSCTEENDHFFIDYAYDDADYNFHALRIHVPLKNPELESISKIYNLAFLYENEIHDLFGIKVHGMIIDYGGKFYRINKKNPFCKSAEQKSEE